MKLKLTWPLALALVATLLIVAGTVRLALHTAEWRRGSNFEMTLIHTNDFHSRIKPINRYDSTCKEEGKGKCFGGSARLANKVNEIRAEATRPVLLVDGGDQFQGSMFYSYYKGKAAAEFMNRLGYEAMVLGNHEFDDGPETVAAFLKRVKFPVVSSNIRTDRPDFARLKKSVVIEKGGERIGIIGYTTEDTVYLSKPGKVQILEPFKPLQAEVDQLRDQGINKIILLSHAGFPRDRKVAKKVSGIDVIVSGHTNTFLRTGDPEAEGNYPTVAKSPGGKVTLIVSAYAFGKYLGKLDVAFDPFGEVVGFAGGPITLDETIEKDAEIAARVRELEKPLVAFSQEVVASAEQLLVGNRKACRQEECTLGNWMADAMRAESGAEFAVLNGGGIRASIDAGKVTTGDWRTVFPYSNTLSTFKLKGEDVKAMFEHGVSAVTPALEGRFLQVSGARYQWDPSAGEGERVVSIEVQQKDGSYQPLDPERVYSIATTNYVRQGGDKFEILDRKAIEPYDFGPNIVDVMIKRSKQAKRLSAKVEGRIKRVE
jgi:5'-nucleotidase/UDP-sugar diphosphatase